MRQCFLFKALHHFVLLLSYSSLAINFVDDVIICFFSLSLHGRFLIPHFSRYFSEERLDASSSEQGEAKEMKNLDPLLETVMKMLKLGGKKQKKASEPTMTEEDGANTKEPLTSDKESSHLNEQEQAKASTVEELEEPQEDPADKIKVRVSRLGEDERKILEENEKQEELSGPNKANNRLKKAGKKIEDLIKKKLKKAGVDLGGILCLIFLAASVLSNFFTFLLHLLLSNGQSQSSFPRHFW